MDNIRLNICIVFVNLILLISISILSFAQNIEPSKIGYKTLNNAQNPVEMSERQIEFAGCNWYVKSGENLGPGPNHWSDSEQSVWVDSYGWLHLKIREVNGTWYCAEVYTKEIAIYGMYRFFVISHLDSLDKNVVAALFLYKDDQHEIDIEFSKWGWENPNNTWYVVQPSWETGNIDSFQMTLDGTYTTHSIDWHRSYPYNDSYFLTA